MTLYTIGFTKKSAEQFFGLLRSANVRRLVDTRLNNVSQLAGFAKREDLAYFLRAICGIPYQHEPRLAPTQAMLDSYKKAKGAWQDYEREFISLMREREIEQQFSAAELEGACLLCSEATAEHCHRRLVAEYLAERWDGVEIIHL